MKHLKFKIITFLSFFLITFLIFNLELLTSVYAHILQTDGSIGAVMHINPDDDPIAGQPTNFFFEIKDKQRKFTPQNCNCRVDIYQSGKMIYSDALYQQYSTNSIGEPVFQYTFPQKDIYQVKLIGTPETKGQFQSFTITYDVRVDKGINTQSETNSQTSQVTAQSFFAVHWVQLLGGGFLLLILISVLIYQSRKQSISK